jgi:long-chain acyl-CoA synthetase
MLGVTNLGDLARPDPADHEIIIDLRQPDVPRTWALGDLRAAATAIARGLHRTGLVRGDRVAILAENCSEFVAAYLGTMMAGMVSVPVNFRLPRDTIAFVVGDAGVKAAFVDAGRRDLVPPGLRRFEFDAGSYDRMLDPGSFTPVVPEAGEIAKILYTSGSTGRPKGVPLSHDGQLWALSKSWTGGDAPLQDRSLIVAPTYHKNGLFFTSVALSNGIGFVSMPRFDPRAYLEAVERYRCTILSGIPTMFALMAREKELLARLDLESVKLVTIGSAPLTEALLGRVGDMFPNAVLQNGYGTTEAGPAVFGPHPDGRPRPGIALGVPYSEVEVRLVDGSSDDEGVLQMRTPALMRGYLNLPDVTAARVKDGWYDSGDVMRRDEDGFYYFVGRADDMFVCGGENVYPGEVEKLLERCPGVVQAAVVPIPDEIKGAIPVAFVVRSSGSAADEAGVKAFALHEGPAYAHPRFVIFCDVIPVASTHKVDRAALIADAVAFARERGRG